MPIGDLLAAITGEKSEASSGRSSTFAPAISKRRAEHDLDSPVAKTPRINVLPHGRPRDGGDSSLSSTRPIEKYNGTARPGVEKYHGTARLDVKPKSQSAVLSNKTSTKNVTPAQTRTYTTSSVSREIKPVRASGMAAEQARSGQEATKAELKKGSFKEIMARAAAASATRPTLGKISHKTAGKSAPVNHKKEANLEDDKGKSQKPGGRVMTGKNLGVGVPGRPSAGIPKEDGRSGTGKVSEPGRNAPPVEKKVKKAALATTGYTGTARPRPGASTSKADVSSRHSTASRRLEPPALLRKSYTSRRRDDYDEDLDDFIDYDDEEDDPRPRRGRGGYDSLEEDSDMEAGISDIDEEEQRAAYIARREDKREEALEKEMKRRKEQRRQLLGAN